MAKKMLGGKRVSDHQRHRARQKFAGPGQVERAAEEYTLIIAVIRIHLRDGRMEYLKETDFDTPDIPLGPSQSLWSRFSTSSCSQRWYSAQRSTRQLALMLSTLFSCGETSRNNIRVQSGCAQYGSNRCRSLKNDGKELRMIALRNIPIDST